MGYHTAFRGELKFTKELLASQIAYLQTILGEDCRDHPEWNTRNLYCIDLELNVDYSGIGWDESEKTYDMDLLVELVIRLMQERYPDFGLEGKLSASGEEFDDRWELVVENNMVERREVVIEGTVIECPNCESKFVLATTEKEEE